MIFYIIDNKHYFIYDLNVILIQELCTLTLKINNFNWL